MQIRWNRLLAVVILCVLAWLLLAHLDQIVDTLTAFVSESRAQRDRDPLRAIVAVGILGILAVSVIRILLLEDCHG